MVVPALSFLLVTFLSYSLPYTESSHTGHIHFSDSARAFSHFLVFAHAVCSVENTLPLPLADFHLSNLFNDGIC